MEHSNICLAEGKWTKYPGSCRVPYRRDVGVKGNSLVYSAYGAENLNKILPLRAPFQIGPGGMLKFEVKFLPKG